MKKAVFLLVSLALVLAACAPAAPATNNAGMMQTPAAPDPASAGNGNLPMQTQTGNGGMTPVTGVINTTAEPGAMTASNPAAAHMMEPITAPNVGSASAEQGGQPLNFRLENGVKVFELTAKAVKWTLTDGVEATAYTYNGTVPGPMIRVTEGDQVRIIVKNELPDPTTIHWHGIEVPNAMDGVPGMTQDSIQPGETFTYEFTAKPAGTFMYHSHYDGDVQVGAGLYAPFIIDPREPEANPATVDKTLMLSEWRVQNGITYATMPMGGMEPNYFTINGKAFPSTETINVKKGEVVRLRLIGIGQFVHPMHLHGFSFKVIATDSHPVPEAAQLTKDTISVAPGERYDIEFVATEPGKWMLHCHILHHTTNDNVEPGGLMLVINVTE
ncbi:MAG: copper oxidase [Anaerolineae bacterium CG_4_9_14_3_um_filter_57_17]|nr:MAG: copper oxidase [Anaerolineae bacterium CG_4_9_14_3_um_filter_57_17]